MNKWTASPFQVTGSSTHEWTALTIIVSSNIALNVSGILRIPLVQHLKHVSTVLILSYPGVQVSWNSGQLGEIVVS